MLWLLRLIYKRLDSLLQLLPFFIATLFTEIPLFRSSSLGSGERSVCPFLALTCLFISTCPPDFWVYESCRPLPYQLPSTDPLLQRRWHGCPRPNIVGAIPRSYSSSPMVQGAAHVSPPSTSSIDYSIMFTSSLTLLSRPAPYAAVCSLSIKPCPWCKPPWIHLIVFSPTRAYPLPAMNSEP